MESAREMNRRVTSEWFQAKIARLKGSYDRGPLNKNGIPDIRYSNDSMPWYPPGMPLWARVMCLLGYHKPERRQCGDDHKYPGMELRRQCGRCGHLL